MCGSEKTNNDEALGPPLRLIIESVTRRIKDSYKTMGEETESMELRSPGDGAERLIIQYRDHNEEVTITSCFSSKAVGKDIRVYTIKLPGPVKARELSNRNLWTEHNLLSDVGIILLGDDGKRLRTLADAVQRWEGQPVSFEEADKLSGIRLK